MTQQATRKSTTSYVTLRMPVELRARAEDYRQALKEAAGGADVPFSFAVFHLIQAGLDSVAQGVSE